MRTPSIKTLLQVFTDPAIAKQAKAVLQMTRQELLQTAAGKARDAECYHAPKTYDLRLHVLNSLDSGLYGVESIESCDGVFADYLNTGASYTPTLIYWQGSYRVQSVGNFIEVQERQGVRFN